MATEALRMDGHDGLVPSQAARTRSRRKKANNANNANNNNRNAAPKAGGEETKHDSPQVTTTTKPPNQRNRRRGGGGKTQPNNPTMPTGDQASAEAGPAQRSAQTPSSKQGKNRGRGPTNPSHDQDGQQNTIETANRKKNNNTKNGNQKKTRKRYPWRRFIPAGTVDPITLDSLQTLEYPPFALMANAPYDPVPVWPVPEEQEKQQQQQQSYVDIEELNRRRIAEQWGSRFVSGGDDGMDTKQAAATEQQAANTSSTKRHYNLYDGRALAYYIVSQLQFIDPLNRRDLTRPELLNLDVYLRRNGFQDLNVTDAYDAKGITISSAGAAANTAQGRADILQQLARNLLNSLFGGQSVSASPTPSRPTNQPTSFLQEQYAAHQSQEQQQQQQRPGRRGRNAESSHVEPPQASIGLNPNASPFDAGFYSSEDGGLMVIDDDENIGMRGGDYTASRGNDNQNLATSDGIWSAAANSNPFYSASHIAARYGNGPYRSNAEAFPELPTPSAPVNRLRVSDSFSTALTAKARGASAKKKPAPKPSKTLAVITGAVKKTNPEEQHRQWKAREEARKRAMMGTTSFGVNTSLVGSGVSPQLQSASLGLPSTASSTGDVVSEEKLQRNKAFAEALGVQPATLRQTFNSGWSRPTETVASLDEFGNELNLTIYPDSLLSQTRDRMGLALKIEKKWKAFLEDDKSASLPLYPMDRATRTFVHHYSDFWNLKTESFDPEPQRYIHCVKLPDTHMPRPLLSDAARKWRGPATSLMSNSGPALVSIADLPRGPAGVVADSQQAAGEPSKSREIPPPPERVPLPLQPRSLSHGEQQDTTESSYKTTSFLGGERYETDQSVVIADRFAPLLEERTRPKIELAKRTIPLELPPFQPPTTQANTSEAELLHRRLRLAEIEKRKKETEERKRQVLEDAFASDDEEDDEEKSDDAASAGSDWDQPDATYQGSDGEDE